MAQVQTASEGPLTDIRAACNLTLSWELSSATNSVATAFCPDQLQPARVARPRLLTPCHLLVCWPGHRQSPSPSSSPAPATLLFRRQNLAAQQPRASTAGATLADDDNAIAAGGILPQATFLVTLLQLHTRAQDLSRDQHYDDGGGHCSRAAPGTGTGSPLRPRTLLCLSIWQSRRPIPVLLPVFAGSGLFLFQPPPSPATPTLELQRAAIFRSRLQRPPYSRRPSPQ